MDRVLVTGASGFIGRAVVAALVEGGARPRALVRDRGARADLVALGAEVVPGSLERPGLALEGVGTVCHFAYDIRSPGSANLRQFDGFLAAIRGAGVRQIVHASSVVVHDGWPDATLEEASPVTPPAGTEGYRAAKIAMERRLAEAVAAGSLEAATILRPTLVYGPGSRIWTDAVVGRLRAGPVLLPEPPAGHPEGAPFGTCHILHVEDLARAVVAAARADRAGVRDYLLSDPNPPTWADYYRRHAEVMGRGTVRLVPCAALAARLPPAQAATSAEAPGAAARASSLVRGIVGSRAVDAVAARLRRPARSDGAEVLPDRFLFELYTSIGAVDAGRAARELDFAPAKSFEERVAEMADLLR